MQYYLTFVSFLLGAIIGSFLNVVIYRLPLKESLLLPASHCPNCGNPVRPYDNIPIVSWLVLRGKCRDCKSGISVRYPLVEALTGVLFLGCFLYFDFSWSLPVAWFFVAVLVAVAFIDFDHKIIPAKIVLPAAVICLAVSISMNPQNWWKYLVASFGGAAFVFAFIMLWPGGGMGMGDFYMALFMGAFLGSTVIVAFFTAFLFGSIVGLTLIALKKATRKSKIPFGPYLAAGSLVAMFVGQFLLHSYINIINV